MSVDKKKKIIKITIMIDLFRIVIFYLAFVIQAKVNIISNLRHLKTKSTEPGTAFSRNEWKE